MTRILLIAFVATSACTSPPQPGASSPSTGATLAQVYYWRAKPGRVEEYEGYIKGFAEAVDAEARRAGAFLSVTTYISRDPAAPWSHMRVFLLRDSAQLQGLSAALELAGARLEPDSTKRRARAQHVLTLRDRVGAATYEVLH